MDTKVWMMRSSVVCQIVFLLALSPTVLAQEWRSYGGDAGGTRSSPLKQINRQNVKNLKRAWTYHMGELDRGGNETDRHHIAPFESTPIAIGGMLYFSTPSNRVIALDAETGQEIWQFDPQAGRAGPRQFFQHRGVAYWQSKTGGEGRILYGTFDGRLIALDAKTGKLYREFGKDGAVDLRAGVADAYPGAEYSVTSPPAIYRDLVITGAAVPEYPSKGPSGAVRAFDVRTGKLVWYYQMVHHDIWDYDMPAQPLLITVRRDGRDIPAIAQLTKMGFVFILDRLTGKPLFSVEERPVPKSDVPGEAAWPTQPFPVKPPPLVRQSLSEGDISTVTPESNRYCAQLFHSLESHGMYTPYGRKMTLVVPGTLGGANWSGASFDSASGYLFVNANELGAIGAMEPQAADAPVRYRRGSKEGEYARFWDEHQWPCQKPPWGTLNAVDVNTGEIVWKVLLGVVDELKTATGTPNLGGTIVTDGGVVFIGATIDSRFRAFDSRTGEQLWAADLEASAHATPITYMGKKSGKQFVVVAAGGGGYFRGKVSDALVAFALPD